MDLFNKKEKQKSLKDLFSEESKGMYDIVAIDSYAYDEKELEEGKYFRVKKEIKADFTGEGVEEVRDIIVRIPKKDTPRTTIYGPKDLIGHVVGVNGTTIAWLGKEIKINNLYVEEV